MALSIDSRAVLRAIFDHPDAFPSVQRDVDEFARKTLIKQVKDKATTLRSARTVRSAVGEKSFATVLDGFAANEMTALLKKLDPHNPLVRDGDAVSTRAAIDGLVQGRAEPAAKAEKVAKAPARKAPAKAPARPKIGTLLQSEVHAGEVQKKPRAKKPA